MKKSILALSIALAATSSLSFAETLEVKINPGKTYQTVDNFTAADAWSGNFVGQYFDEAQKGQVAKWLFSQKIGADGNPEGIGLSMWRINVGGGSLERDGADIMPFQRRAESFLTKDGKGYDWGKCAGQQYFMRKAKEYGCDKFLLFSNTPPVQWTRNGKGYAENTKDFSSNLKPDCYGKFADFLADVAKHFQDGGFNIAYISPINEPQVNWDSNRQEGSPWQCSDMKKCIVELDRAISEKNVKTKILVGETAHPKYNYLASSAPSGNLPPRWNKEPPEENPNFIIKKFFDKNSKFYIGGLKNVPNFIGGHSYHSHLRNAEMEETHKALAAECEKYGIGYQQTEWCLLPHYTANRMDGFTSDWFSDNRTDIQTGLLIGRIIYSDFVNSKATAWGYWKGMEVNGNYALIGVYPVDGDLTKGGVVRDNKILWALGNYSLFVRPGYKRIELAGANNLDKVAGVAFVSPDAKRIVAVFVNSSFEKDTADIDFPDAFEDRVENVRVFRTDANMNLANVQAQSKDSFVIAPRSITTVVFDLK